MPWTSREVLAFLMVILALVVSEVSIRLTESTLSGNIAHIHQIPNLVQSSKRHTDSSIVIIGNSLANNGFDLETISRDAWPQWSEENSAIKIVPDGTNIWPWLCILEEHFPKDEKSSGILVIPFAWNQLGEQ